MSQIDFSKIRGLLASLSTDHDADGEHRPQVGEVFAPEQHASALAPSTLVVVGARGAGKSFWAGVLGQDDTRSLAAQVYPRLGLDRLMVQYGYNGFSGSGAGTSANVNKRVSESDDHYHAVFFWQIVILRSALIALGADADEIKIKSLMNNYSDPEDYDAEILRVDRQVSETGMTLLIIFDALDTLSREWKHLTALTDALFEAVWSLRARKSIRAKVFIRPDQLNDDGLRFIELPKLRSGRVELQWNRSDLYGLLYSRLADLGTDSQASSFRDLAKAEGFPVPAKEVGRLRDWKLASNEAAQKKVMERLSGLYMGNGANKGATYPWTFRHLADAKGVVTPRSFVKLFVEAAKYHHTGSNQALTAEAIRHGLREASKTRVEQLALEYRWVKRALAPLAGLKVPCERSKIHSAWSQSDTVKVILDAAVRDGFLPPFRSGVHDSPDELLETAMERIGVLAYRPDGRVDMPDLFRIAARMLKRGGVALTARN